MQSQAKSFEGFRSLQTRPSKTLEATRPLSRPAKAGRASLQSCKALLGRDESGANHLAAISSQDAASKRQVSCASTAMVKPEENALSVHRGLMACIFTWQTTPLGSSGRRPAGEDACAHQRPVSLRMALVSGTVGTGSLCPDWSAALAMQAENGA